MEEFYFSPFKGKPRTVGPLQSVEGLMRSPEFHDYMEKRGLTQQKLQEELSFLEACKKVRSRVPDLANRLIDPIGPVVLSANEKIGDLSSVPSARLRATLDLVISTAINAILGTLWLAGMLDLHPYAVDNFGFIGRMFGLWVLLHWLCGRASLVGTLLGVVYIDERTGHVADAASIRRVAIAEATYAVCTLGTGFVLSVLWGIWTGTALGFQACRIRVVRPRA